MQVSDGRQYFGVGLDLTQLRQGASEARSLLHGIGQQAVSEGSEMDAVFNRMRNTVAGVFAISQIKDFVGQIISTRGEIQSMEVAFQTLLGNKEKANAMFSEIRQFAVSTPMMMKDLASGAQQMLAFGIEADRIMPLLRALGDVSMGDSQKFQSLTLAFSQMSATGKLMGQDLLQMINAGFNPLQVIAEQTGKTIGELKEEMSKGAISSDMVAQAFMDATSEGGKFHNMLQNMSGGVEGQMSNLQGAIDDMMNELGEQLQGTVAAATTAATYLVQHYEPLLTILGTIIATYGTYKAALMVNAAVESVVAKGRASSLAVIEAEIAAVGVRTATETIATDAQLAEAVAKGNLTEAEALHILSLKGEAAARVQTLAATAAQAKADLAAAAAAEQAALVRLQAAEAQEAIAIRQLALAEAQGDVFVIASAKTEVNTAANLRNAASQEYQAAAAAKDAAARVADTTATEANTAATALNNIGMQEGTRQAGFFSSAMGLLNNMFKKAIGTLKAHPFAAIAAAVVALGVAIYKATNDTSEWDKANAELDEKLEQQQETLKELNKEYDATEGIHEQAAKEIAKEIDKVENLQETINNETLSIDDRRKAIKQLQSIVPDYQASLSDEGALYVSNTNAVGNYIDKLEELALAEALQSKRKTLRAQKLDAELNRKGSEKRRKQAEDAVIAARKKVKEDMAKAEKSASGRGVKMASMAMGKENHMVAVADAQEVSKATAQSEAELKLAEKNLKLWETNLAIYDKRISNANAGLKQLKEYQEENNIKPIEEPNEDDKPKPDKPRVDARDDKERLKAEAQERQKALNEYKESLKEQDAEASFDLRQKRLELDEDGVQKELDQVKLNYDRLKHENEKRRKEMYDELASKKIVEYLDAHPNAKQSEVNDYAANLQITDKDLTEQQRSQLAEYDKIAEEYLAKGNKRVLDEMLADVQTYAQQRQKILDEYAKRESELYTKNDDGSRGGLREGVTQGNVDELQRQRDEALTSVDEQFASREDEFQEWCNAIGNLSLEQLQAVLENAKRKLAELEASGKATDAQLAVARAKVNKATKAVGTAKRKNDVSPGKRTLKEWEDLYKTLNDVRGSFEEIGEAVGGVVGDIISECGKMAASTMSMINSIVQLANWSTISTQMAAQGASKAIQTVEKASVILTIISAAMQIAMQIVNLFNKDNKKQEEIDALQQRIDQLQWELDNAELVRSRKFAEGGSYLAQLQTELAKTRYEMLRLGASTADWTRMLQGCYGKVSESSELMTATVDKLAKAYGNMAYTADKALGAEKYKSANEQLKNIAQQQLLIQEQIDIERSKKKTDSDAIAEYERKIEELGQQALEVINDMVEDIIGDSATGIAEELADAFFEAFAAGEDAAKAWGDKVNEIVGDILKRMMVQKFLEEPLGRVFDRYKAKWFPNGEFAGMDAVINSMTSFANDLNGKLAGFQAVMDALPDEMRQYFLDNIEDERSASQGGIATASQESVDELNGRATAIQGHTYSISENTKTLVANTSAILASVMNIENNTGSMAQDLMNIHTDIRNVRASVDHIQMHGLKLTN